MKFCILLLLATCTMTLADTSLLPGAAGENPASAPAHKVPKPVLVATDTYVRSDKYQKIVFHGVPSGSSGLPAATTASICIWPRAIRFVGRHDRTYITFGDRRCHPAIVFYDHRSRRWSKPRQISTTGVTDDTHGLPTLAVNRQGYLHVVFGSHNSPQYAIRSSAPEQIERWEPPTVVASRATYSDLFFVGDSLHIFHRDGSGAWGFRNSNDGGKTWSELRAVCRRFNRPFNGEFYPGVSIGAENPVPRLHLFWLYYGPPGWKNMYYAISPDLGKNWQRAGGQAIGPQIEYGQGDPVYEGDTHGWHQRIVVDPSGRAGLLFGTGGAGIVDDNRILFASWTAPEWRVSKICDVASRYCQGTALVKGVNHYRVYVPTGQWNGGEIFEFETTDGGRTWKHIRQLTRNSPVPNNSPQTVENAAPELQIFWGSGERGAEGKLYAWGEAGTLAEQPDPVIAPAQP
ncbi:MAG: BNR repeat-containing protein [Candidatus Sumerlaeia bacterium]|nr:BNR repeat-containing protein [Candidatus Sumerlaeia bacterium]